METQELITYAKKVPGLDKLIEDVVLQINRSAEDAAKQALRGLFIKVQDQEKLIRTDINARTSDLLRRVFGSR
ncbi:MAG: DUF4197 family protein [Bacteroidales bacterium]